MTSSSARSFALSLASMFAAASLGCNFILNPEGKDDVIRCKNTTECEQEPYFFEALNTKRLDASCDAPGGGGSGDISASKTNQVCSVVDKVSVSCDPAVFMKGPFYDAWERANTNASAYIACPLDLQGSLGCAPPFNGNCNAGLSVNGYGVCDDDKSFPLYAPSDPKLFGQDVKDQHCRSYFCDDEFVCNGRTKRCVRCDPSKTGAADLGQGACAELALQGQRSTVYQDNETLVEACLDPSEVEKTAFGPPVVFTPMP